MSVLPFGVDNSANEAALENHEQRIAALEANPGGGDAVLPVSLDDTTDSETRFALTASEKLVVDSLAVNQGAAGDLHATATGNPHGTTAGDVGAPTAAAFTSLSNDVDAAEAAIANHETRLDAAEATIIDNTADIASIDTRVDNLEGAGKQWVVGPFMVRNAQSFTNMPAGPAAWTNTLAQKVSLWKASRLFMWCQIGAADTNTNAAVRLQYTTDLVNDTGWTDFSGMDVPLSATSNPGKFSSIINVPSGAKTQEFVLVRAAGVNGGGNQTPTISFPTLFIELDAIGAPGSGGGSVDSFNGRTGTVNPATGDYTFDQISETATGKKYTATEQSKLAGIASGAQVNTVTSVCGRTGAVVATTGDYTTAQLTESTDKKHVTDAEKTRIGSAKLPDDTIAALAGKAALADGITSAERTKLGNVPSNTTTDLASKAPIDSPTFTTAAFAPTPGTSDNSAKIATTSFVKNQGYLTSVPSHTHAQADVSGLVAAIADLQTQINTLSGGASSTKTTMTVSSETPINISDYDIVIVDHSTKAFLRIPDTLSKKAHVIVMRGTTAGLTVNIAGATGQAQSVDGASGTGLTFTSGTKQNAATRIILPVPGNDNLWAIF